jgi:hypothetical protein
VPRSPSLERTIDPKAVSNELRKAIAAVHSAPLIAPSAISRSILVRAFQNCLNAVPSTLGGSILAPCWRR